MDPTLPPITGSDRVLIDSLDGVVVYDDVSKVDPDASMDDAQGLIYEYPDRKSLVHSAAFRNIVNSYLGQAVSLRSINQLSRDIINLYRHNKQPIIDVLVPEQKITGGTVKIVVIEGRIGSVKYRGLEYSKPEMLNRWIAHTYRGNRIYEPWLDNDLFWLNQNQFRRVTLDLKSGTAEGTTDFFFDVDEVFPVRGYMGYEDTGVELLGLHRFLAGFIYGNVFGYDGVLSYQYTADSNFDRVNAHAITYEQPLERDLSWSTYASWSEVEPDLMGFNQTGLSWLWGGSMKKLLCKTRTLEESVSAGFEFKSTNNSLEFGGVGLTDSIAEIAQINLGYDFYEYTGCDQYTQIQADTWIGVGPGFTTHNNAASLNTIRAASSPDYIYSRVKYEEAFNVDEANRWQAVVRATGQASSERVLFSETLGLGGYDSIRGYDQRIASGDHGWITSLEFGPRPSNLDLGSRQSRWRMFMFTDVGQTFLADPLPGESRDEFLASTGVGCQLQVGQSITFHFDYGHTLNDVLGQTDDSRVHLGLIWLFGPEL